MPVLRLLLAALVLTALATACTSSLNLGDTPAPHDTTPDSYVFVPVETAPGDACTNCDANNTNTDAGAAPRRWLTVQEGGLDVARAVWAWTPSDVWVGGGDGTYHYDGARWTASASNNTATTIYGVWGSTSTDVWAVGQHGTSSANSSGIILHWNGMTWSPVTTQVAATLRGVWGSGAKDVWAVGSGGTILHWNGFKWTAVDSLHTDDLYGVSGTSSTNAWAVGAGGTILNWEGTAWNERVSSGAYEALYSVHLVGPTDIWALGEHGLVLHRKGGLTWNRVSTPVPVSIVLRGISGTTPNNLWAVGDTATIVHWDGTKWSSVATASRMEIMAVTAHGDDAWAVGHNWEPHSMEILQYR